MRLKSLLCACVLLLGTLLLADDKMDFAGAHDQFTAVVMQATVRPIAFAGSDGMTHLDYELQLINARNLPVTIESIEVLDAESGLVLLTISGDDVKKNFTLIDQSSTNKLEASQAGYGWLDVRVQGAAPKRLTHRVTVLTAMKGATPATPAAEMKMVERKENGGEVAVATEPALVIGPPLEGTRWVATGACCHNLSHRRAGMPINGELFVAQRFAIDWIKLDDEGRVAHGSVTNNKDYPTYGQRALAVADATVVSVLDGLPERVAGTLPPDTTLQNVTGNHVILDFGGGRYGFYAHLQPGSIRVKKGDKVKRGQWLALLGNSGNTTGPHLHFHVMNGVSPLGSQGVPYVIDSFSLRGQANEVEDEKDFVVPMVIKPMAPPMLRKNQYPLDWVVMDFPMGK
jgi:hypothetical protein